VKRGLILVDLQYDFMPGGSLEVPEGDEVVAIANRLMRSYDPVVATQDWHPEDHLSFASNHEGREPLEKIELDGLEQLLWPDHCVQGTHGAELPDDLKIARIDRVFRKGTDPRIDSYSGFHDNGHRKSTGLAEWLREEGVDGVDLVGLALDVCVRFTALDAVREGFATRLIVPGCRAVELEEGDRRRTLDELREAGVELLEEIPAEV